MFYDVSNMDQHDQKSKLLFQFWDDPVLTKQTLCLIMVFMQVAPSRGKNWEWGVIWSHVQTEKSKWNHV